MNIKRSEDIMLDYIDGKLSAAESARFESELEKDNELLQSYTALKQVLEAEEELRGQTDGLSPSFELKVMEQIDAQRGFFRSAAEFLSTRQKYVLSGAATLAVLLIVVRVGFESSDMLSKEAVMQRPGKMAAPAERSAPSLEFDQAQPVAEASADIKEESEAAAPQQKPAPFEMDKERRFAPSVADGDFGELQGEPTGSRPEKSQAKTETNSFAGIPADDAVAKPRHRRAVPQTITESAGGGLGGAEFRDQGRYGKQMTLEQEGAATGSVRAKKDYTTDRHEKLMRRTPPQPMSSEKKPASRQLELESSLSVNEAIGEKQTKAGRSADSLSAGFATVSLELQLGSGLTRWPDPGTRVNLTIIEPVSGRKIILPDIILTGYPTEQKMDGRSRILGQKPKNVRSATVTLAPVQLLKLNRSSGPIILNLD